MGNTKNTDEQPTDAWALEVATHEAGHACMAYWSELVVDRVTIVADNGVAGFAMHDTNWQAADEDPDNELRITVANIQTALAGEVAVEMILGIKQDADLLHSDLRQAYEAAERFNGPDEEAIEAMLAWVRIHTANIMRQPFKRAIVTAVAAALMEHRTLTGEQFVKCIVDAAANFDPARDLAT